MKKIRYLNNLCGIDVGCTNIKMTAIINHHTVQRAIPSGDNFTQKELINTISNFYKSFNFNFDGLGIAFSGCSVDGTKVNYTSLQCLDNLSISHFADLHCKNIRLINDSNATALAGLLEYPDSKVLLGITNGTGIGLGITINGSLFTGSNGLSGEIYGNPTIGLDSKIIKSGKICSGSKVYKKINCGSSEICKDTIIKDAAKHLGIQLVSLIHIFNPDVIYLSGGGFSYPNYLDILYDFVHENTYEYFTTDLKIVQSRFSSYAGCYGAMKFLLT